MTIICAPVLIYIIFDLVTMSGLNNLSSQFIHVAFPWVGIYIYALQQNQHRKKKYVFVSFLLMLLLFYGIYVSSLKFLAVVLMFHKTIPDQLDENFFGLIALTEFFNLLFVRTRSSIKWYPKIVVTLIMAFMVHVRCTTYGFYYLGLFLLTLLVFYIMLEVLLCFELPTIVLNPASTFVPTQHRPRLLYLPVFNLNWLYDLPQLWTMFYPLHGRSFFTEAQLSIVDNNTVLFQ